MKILILAPKVPYPPKDGGALATWLPMKGLSEQGQEVSLLAVNTNKHYIADNTIPDEIRTTINWNTVYTDTSITLKGTFVNLFFSSQPYLAERFWTNAFEKKLLELICTHSYDIIQVEGPFLLHYLPLIRKYSKAKVVFRAHNIEYEIWERNAAQEKNILKRLYVKHLAYRIRKFENSIINQYDGLIPITPRDGLHFINMGNTKPMCNIPAGMLLNPIHTQNFEQIKPCFLGALDWIPNQEGLLWFVNEVWPIVYRNYPEMRFHIAGRNAPAFLIRKLSAPGIIFHGEINEAQEFLAQHNVLVAPLFSGSGMRVKIIEGMANSKIVLTTPQGAEGLPCESGKHLYIATSAKQFASLFDLLHSNASLAGQISVDARKFIEQNYDNSKLSTNLFNFYQTLI